MSGIYEVRLKDPLTGDNIHVFDKVKFIQLKRVVDKPGYYQLLIDGADPFFDLFTLDVIVEFWRRDDNHGVQPYREFTAFHRTEVRSAFTTALTQRTSFGRGILDLVHRRIVAGRANRKLNALLAGGYIDNTDNITVGEAMKYLLENHVGINAVTTLSFQRESFGVTPGFNVLADGVLTNGGVWSGNISWRNCLDVLQEMSEWSRTDPNSTYEFYMEYQNPLTFNLYIKENGIGEDKTIGNGARTPVVFSQGMGNTGDIWVSYTRSEEINRIFALDNQIENARELTIATSANHVPILYGGNGSDSSPFNLIEASRQMPNQSAAQIEVFAATELRKNVADRSATFVPLSSSGSVYGVDYFLGDKVTVLHEGIRIDTRIISVEILYTEDRGEKIVLEFSNEFNRPSPSNYIVDSVGDSDSPVEVATAGDIQNLSERIDRLEKTLSQQIPG